MTLYRIRRALKPLFWASVAAFAVSWFFKGRFVDASGIRPPLLQEPIQGATDREPFSFEYKGKACRVRPVASWEQWGLVVSHNNIESFADMVHDNTSVDTKDLCVIWGANLTTDDFRFVEYSSGQFTCYYSYDRARAFYPRALGNDHLITDRDSVRERIGAVRVGDQVRLVGLLVDYQMDDWRGSWRKTSTRRDDSGCEVVFVEELEILARGTPLWYALYDVSKRLLWVVPVVWLIVFWLEARTPGSRVGEL